MGIENSDARQKSPGTLMDELVTVVIKCFNAQEKVMAGGTDEEVAKAAKIAQETNGRRNQLIRAIDAYFGDPNSPTAKTYIQEGGQISEMDLVEQSLRRSNLSTLCDYVLKGDFEMATKLAKVYSNHA